MAKGAIAYTAVFDDLAVFEFALAQIGNFEFSGCFRLLVPAWSLTTPLYGAEQSCRKQASACGQQEKSTSVRKFWRMDLSVTQRLRSTMSCNHEHKRTAQS